MHLKRLELAGFKSFGKKSSILFDAPVTAIVGPNGSGKSNVAESIRFVLGEQSMKSLRGKSGTDLIFRGSKALPKQNRASVSIAFDNAGRAFKRAGADGGEAALDFDEVVITREVYADGANEYLLNGSPVRLKDILELLASVNIGASGHHIISQGEADRILSASLKERRAMIEDALGLKIYQYRIRESLKKLEKTEANVKEVGLLRREIAPHLAFLKKQVEKIEKAKEVRAELEVAYVSYLKREELEIAAEKEALATERQALQVKLSDVAKLLAHSKQQEDGAAKRALEDELSKIQDLQRQARAEKDELSRKLGRIEGMIELEAEKAKEVRESGDRMIPVSSQALAELRKTVAGEVERALASGTLDDAKRALVAVRTAVWNFMPEKHAGQAAQAARPSQIVMDELKAKRAEILGALERFAVRESEHDAKVAEIRRAMDAEIEKEKDRNRAHFEAQMRERELKSASDLAALKEESLGKRIVAFEEEVREGGVLIGGRVFAYRTSGMPPVLAPGVTQEDERRKIERLKIKLEDLGGAGGDDVMKEFEEVTARDAFLVREIDDLNRSITSLHQLIAELKERLETEFKDGVEKINAAFGEFFKKMFGGGTASLALVTPVRRKKRGEEDEEDDLDDEADEETAVEQGIDIAVSLPHKKVRDIHMFSGGERSLTSIALLFAISQVNPPPFLVLDETDAALDEANSRRYGEMLDMLSAYSQLIVITHNRETMSHAQALYGVTVGADGASKLLSVRFEEAAAVAK